MSAGGAARQSQSFALPEALKQFVIVVPSKVRLVCLAAFILDKCKVKTLFWLDFAAIWLVENRSGMTAIVIIFKFSQNNKLIVFVSSCEAVEFLHSLFTSILFGPTTKQKPRLSFLRLHGNMKQEVRPSVWTDTDVCFVFELTATVGVFVFPNRSARTCSNSSQYVAVESCCVQSVSLLI